MSPSPPSIAALLAPFAPLFSRRVRAHVQTPVTGALLASAQRTVAAALRATGVPTGRRSTAITGCSATRAGRASPSGACSRHS